ncbi:hypothetical protein L210DRAFT_3655102 [Boletus edulis BED1]|uniref:Uncharacterized protein n=1 Tax=Boletus edulis BED1 TaxID=1328754 RepID=A0AAD4BCZ1_BOLED|nr:hypothetical protein L210DRAFT_3655102 [Boletus edulis BED1]
MEVQREIFLMFRDRRDVHRYAHVAKKMHVWLEPYVYRVVRLRGDNSVRKFLAVVAEGSQALSTKKLVLCRAVSISNVVQVLTLCRNVEDLAMQHSLRYIARHSINPLLQPMSNLLRIKTMYTELATVAGEEHVILPDFVWFTRLSHLHLSISWPSLDAVPEGISTLANLTHLSMFWTTSRSCTTELVRFLEKDSTVVLIVWVNEWAMESPIQRDLRLRGLQDSQVVIFRSCLMDEYMAAGGFWKYAESVVKWRVDNKACPSHHPQRAHLQERLQAEPPVKKARLANVYSQPSRHPPESQDDPAHRLHSPLIPDSEVEPSGQSTSPPTKSHKEPLSQSVLQSGSQEELGNPPPSHPIASSSQQPLGPRTRRLPGRYRDVQPEPPISLDLPPPPTNPIKHVLLVVYDSLRTQFNRFGIAREYRHRPSHDPDSFVSPADLSTTVRIPSSQPDEPVQGLPPPWPWKNMSIWHLMSWVFTGTREKSLLEVNKLVRDVLQAPNFSVEELEGFDARTESIHMDQQASVTSNFISSDKWRQTPVDILVPTREESRTGNGQ